MPITAFLSGEHFDPDPTHNRRRIRSGARVAYLSDVSGRVVEIVAKKIIELAKAGEHNPDALCERALAELGHRPSRDAIARPVQQASQIQR